MSRITLPNFFSFPDDTQSLAYEGPGALAWKWKLKSVTSFLLPNRKLNSDNKRAVEMRHDRIH